MKFGQLSNRETLLELTVAYACMETMGMSCHFILVASETILCMAMENMVTNFRLSFGDLVLTQASQQTAAVKEPVFAKDGDYGYYGYSPHFPFTIDGNALRRWRAVRRGVGVSDLQDICRLGHTIVALAGIQGALVLPPILTGSIRAATEESQVTSVAIY